MARITRTLQNTGAERIDMPDYASVRKLIITPLDFKFDTVENALTKADWETAIKDTKAKRIYPLVVPVSSADKSQALVVEARALAGDKPIREGKTGLELVFDVNMGVLRKLRSFNNYAGRVFLADENNNVFGTSEDGTIVQGYTIQSIYTSNYKNPGDAEAKKATMDLVLKTPIEQVDLGISFKPEWDVYSLDGIYDVIGEVSNPATTGFDLDLYVEDSGVNVQGLAKTDFTLVKGSTPTTITSISDSTDGKIHFTATLTAGTYTLSMVAPSAITLTDWAIELKSDISVVVPT